MSRVPANFRQKDVTRAIKAAKSAGLPIARVEVDPVTAKISVIVGAAEEIDTTKKNPWDDAHFVLPKRRRRNCDDK